MTRRTLASVLLLIALACTAACSGSSDSAEPGPSGPSAPDLAELTYSPHSVGFGEAMNTKGGAHRVLSMTLGSQSNAVDVPGGNQAVTALVSECASPRGAITVSSQGWTLVTQPAGDQPLTSPVELQPTDAGSPSIDDSRSVAADSCAMADLVFVVPDGTQVIGFHYQQAGSRTATWIKTPG